MYTLIDKVRVAPATNIPTVGFQTLLCMLTGSATYTGTQAEADAIRAGVVVMISDNADSSGAVATNREYIQTRVQAGSSNAFLEVVLTKAFVASITLPAGVTMGTRILTAPSVSEVSNG